MEYMTDTEEPKATEANKEVESLKTQLQQLAQNANAAMAKRDAAIVNMVLTLFSK